MFFLHVFLAYTGLLDILQQLMQLDFRARNIPFFITGWLILIFAIFTQIKRSWDVVCVFMSSFSEKADSEINRERHARFSLCVCVCSRGGNL